MATTTATDGAGDVHKEADREKVTAMLKRIAAKPSLYQTLPASWTRNEAFVKDAVRVSEGAVLRYVDRCMLQRVEGWDSLLLDVLKYNANGIAYASIWHRSSKDFMMRAVQIRGEALRWGSGEVRADADVAVAAVAHTSSAVRFAHWCLRDDKAFWKRAIRENAHALYYGRFLGERADRDLVLAAVSKKGSLLQIAHPLLRADEDIVRAAVCQDGNALRYASSQLRADEQTARLAAVSTANAIVYISDALWETIDRRSFVRRMMLFHRWSEARLVLIGASHEKNDALCPFTWLAAELIDRIFDQMAGV